MAVSLAVHGLLLTSTWPPSPGAGGVNTPLEATLRRPSVQALAPQEPPRPARPSSSPRLASEAPVAPPPASVATVNDSTTETARRSEPAGGAAAVVVAPSGGDGPDAEGLRSFRIALASRFRKFYPPRAIEAGWVGTTEVWVSMAADGGSLQVKVAHSSGHEALDAAALAMLRQALPSTPLPDSLRGRAFAFDLPVTFELLN